MVVGGGSNNNNNSNNNLSLSISQSLSFNGHFPGELGLAGLISTKDDGSGGDNWSYKMGKAPIK